MVDLQLHADLNIPPLLQTRISRQSIQSQSLGLLMWPQGGVPEWASHPVPCGNTRRIWRVKNVKYSYWLSRAVAAMIDMACRGRRADGKLRSCFWRSNARHPHPSTPTLRSRSLPGQVLNQAPNTILCPQVLGLAGGIPEKLRSLARVLKGARSRGELVLDIMKQWNFVMRKYWLGNS